MIRMQEVQRIAAAGDLLAHGDHLTARDIVRLPGVAGGWRTEHAARHTTLAHTCQCVDQQTQHALDQRDMWRLGVVQRRVRVRPLRRYILRLRYAPLRTGVVRLDSNASKYSVPEVPLSMLWRSLSST